MSWVNEAVEIVQKTIAETLKTHPMVRIAVCGGRSPQPLYEALNQLDLPWQKILWIQTDERYVPADHPENNARMIREKLLHGHPETHFLSFDTSLEWEASAEAMNRELLTLKSEREPVIDLAILGVGEDGHVAGIFEWTEDREKLAFTSTTKIHAVEKRMTLSPETLKKSGQVLFLVIGEQKKKIFKDSSLTESPFRMMAMNLTKMNLHIIYG